MATHRDPCPCGLPRDYADCCGRLHGGQAAASAEELMRSRYCAYVRRDEAYLLASWHPGTRPGALGLDDPSAAPTWLGLDVKRHAEDGDTAVVEFVARFRHGGGKAQRLHEVSRFVREDGRWYYVDGDVNG